jgi:hypothetical protein
MRRRGRRSTRYSAPSLRVVGPFISQDTINALESLLARARAGEIIGIAYVAIAPRSMAPRRYYADTAGEAKRDPTFALGMLQVISHIISDTLA